MGGANTHPHTHTYTWRQRANNNSNNNNNSNDNNNNNNSNSINCVNNWAGEAVEIFVKHLRATCVYVSVCVWVITLLLSLSPSLSLFLSLSLANVLCQLEVVELNATRSFKPIRSKTIYELGWWGKKATTGNGAARSTLGRFKLCNELVWFGDSLTIVLR